MIKKNIDVGIPTTTRLYVKIKTTNYIVFFKDNHLFIKESLKTYHRRIEENCLSCHDLKCRLKHFSSHERAART